MDNSYYLSSTDSTTDNLYPALFQCFTIILCGYVAGRLNAVSQTEAKGIGTFVGTFALPSLIFLSLARLDFTVVNWKFLLAILLAKGIVFFAVISVTLLISKAGHLGRAGIFAIFCTQSNDFALGYPIIYALYQQTHPEYALYLYLMAPISLAILNPVAFILMEISKQRENLLASVNVAQRNTDNIRLNMVRQVFKGVFWNPVLLMTILGILGNIVFSHKLPVYIEGLLNVLGQAFSGAALFLLGLRMVGQFHRLRGPALVLPFVLIMVKLIILPVVMRESVSALHAGSNASETQSLSTYAFLYGTVPTAPAVFVFSNQYQLEIDLVASSMVICTFLSAPMMVMSAQMITITKDYADQVKKFGFDLSILSLIATLWVLLLFIITKKYKRMPHKLTICLIISQILLAVSVIWGGPKPEFTPSAEIVIQQAIRIFSMFSCTLWIAMLAIGMLLLQSRGPCFLITLWPVLGFVAWGVPTVMVAVLLATKAHTGNLEDKSTNAIRLCLLVFCLTVCTGSLIAYLRFRRNNIQSALAAEDMDSSRPSPPDELSGLVENAEPISHSQSLSINGCYGAITATPSPSKSVNGCCSNDPDCENALHYSQDIEDMGNTNRECGCPPSHKTCVDTNGACSYVAELERTASSLGLLPAENARHSGQLLRHTVLIIINSLTIFIGLTYTMWSMVQTDDSGVYVEIEFLDVVACYGQGLVMFAVFGLDSEEVVIPAIRYLKRKWYGADTLLLPSVDDLSFETRHVCEQFITHHLSRCKEAIARDTRWRMRTYRGVFRGVCLVRWLIDCGLAKNEFEAVQYGRHLLDGRLIAHVNNAHHFTNSQLLYVFK